MDTTTLVLIAVLIAGVLLARKLIAPRRPKEKSFRCTRCKTTAMHSDRTTNAWRAGKTTFFCNSCHLKWLESQPRTTGSNRGSPAQGSRSGSGCLSVMALVAMIPLAVAAYVLLVQVHA